MGDQCHCGRTGLINERLSMDSSGLEANVRHAERSDCMNVDVLLIIFSEQTDGFDRDESFGWQPSGNNSAVAPRPFFYVGPTKSQSLRAWSMWQKENRPWSP